ncbi:hypothetical protein CEXT_672151 [Caerostris extrusa]|uniref:Uncharacterized protein n=1 Tax=Caerostris extrusa TaxID=172846 RepID=A0AAV4NEB7_CAEEX|nr:hypothetical protein CEXT_672151 [Caerostris extrusa]
MVGDEYKNTIRQSNPNTPVAHVGRIDDDYEKIGHPKIPVIKFIYQRSCVYGSGSQIGRSDHKKGCRYVEEEPWVIADALGDHYDVMRHVEEEPWVIGEALGDHYDVMRH